MIGKNDLHLRLNAIQIRLHEKHDSCFIARKLKVKNGVRLKIVQSFKKWAMKFDVTSIVCKFELKSFAL